MKKILTVILACLMVFGLCACGEVNGDTPVGSDSQAVSDSVADTEKQHVPYDGIFQAGYAREDITPTELPIDVSGNTMTKIMDPLYATCVAVSDGENTALFRNR